MAFTDLTLLKAYVQPYYQEVADQTFLTDMLELEGSPECAAAKIWNMKIGQLGGDAEAIRELRDGSETTKFVDPDKASGVARMQAKYYTKECNKKKGFSPFSLANISRTNVGGAVYEPQVEDDEFA